MGEHIKNLAVGLALLGGMAALVGAVFYGLAHFPMWLISAFVIGVVLRFAYTIGKEYRWEVAFAKKWKADHE